MNKGKSLKIKIQYKDTKQDIEAEDSKILTSDPAKKVNASPFVNAQGENKKEMIHFEIDYDRCLGLECRKCVITCPIKVLGIEKRKIIAARPEECILCFTCKGACPVHLSVIQIEEKEV